MSACNPFLELSDQLCYVKCSFCTTILLVNVPCSSLLKTVTVKCGHCQGLLSVDMGRASFVPLQLLASLAEDDQQKQEPLSDIPPKLSADGFSSSIPSTTADDGDDEEGEEEEGAVLEPPIVNKPPEKRQRAPSAYNHFIKEEIQRIKARTPHITHKEAFSTAAKNWAHFPRIQHKGDGESCSLGGRKVARD